MLIKIRLTQSKQSTGYLEESYYYHLDHPRESRDLIKKIYIKKILLASFSFASVSFRCYSLHRPTIVETAYMIIHSTMVLVLCMLRMAYNAMFMAVISSRADHHHCSGAIVHSFSMLM